MFDVEMEIEDAQRELDRTENVADFEKKWAIFGPTPYSHPAIEDIE